MSDAKVHAVLHRIRKTTADKCQFQQAHKLGGPQTEPPGLESHHMKTLNYEQFSKAIAGRIKTQLPADFQPSEWDVLCGRGKECYNWYGNQKFRAFIGASLDEYQQADTKLKRSLLVTKIVDTIRSRSPTGSGFVRQDSRGGPWYSLGDDAAREKVGQTIRDSMTMHDPEKLATKRLKRALRTAKRDARVRKQRQHRTGAPPALPADHKGPTTTTFAESTFSHQTALLPTVSLNEDCASVPPPVFAFQPPSLHPAAVSDGSNPLSSVTSLPALNDHSDCLADEIWASTSTHWFRGKDSEPGSLVDLVGLDNLAQTFERRHSAASTGISGHVSSYNSAYSPH